MCSLLSLTEAARLPSFALQFNFLIGHRSAFNVEKDEAKGFSVAKTACFAKRRAPEAAQSTERKPQMKIAVSACLLGEPCRYDGKAKPDARLISLMRNHEILPVCPEAAGGLPTPRPPSEQIARPREENAPDGCSERRVRVVSENGDDVTEAFERGAALTLASMLDFGCELAILKAKSPSCGSGLIYDGSFSGTLRPGWGVAAALIRDAGVPVLDEEGGAELCRKISRTTPKARGGRP